MAKVMILKKADCPCVKKDFLPAAKGWSWGIIKHTSMVSCCQCGQSLWAGRMFKIGLSLNITVDKT